ncbi:MAG: CBS domain-containing protein [Clostridia bacterium]|nr:CBS domain-containing protein [Clostridia bacterium]
MIIDKSKSMAMRFIYAYNAIDQALRSIYNYKRSMTFSDMVRRTVPINSVIRKYEDKLIDYARLRNSIIHSSNEEYIIAEPHEDVVILMEKIADMITKPPKLVDVASKKNVLTIEADMALRDVVVLIARSGFKTLPVIAAGKILGIATPNRIVEWVGDKLDKNDKVEDLLKNASISETLKESDTNTRFCIKNEDLTIQEALDLFYKNRVLSAIILTKTGSSYEKILGMVTISDIMDLSKILDDYA